MADVNLYGRAGFEFPELLPGVNVRVNADARHRVLGSDRRLRSHTKSGRALLTAAAAAVAATVGASASGSRRVSGSDNPSRARTSSSSKNPRRVLAADPTPPPSPPPTAVRTPVAPAADGASGITELVAFDFGDPQQSTDRDVKHSESSPVTAPERALESGESSGGGGGGGDPQFPQSFTTAPSQRELDQVRPPTPKSQRPPTADAILASAAPIRAPSAGDARQEQQHQKHSRVRVARPSAEANPGMFVQTCMALAVVVLVSFGLVLGLAMLSAAAGNTPIMFEMNPSEMYKHERVLNHTYASARFASLVAAVRSLFKFGAVHDAVITDTPGPATSALPTSSTVVPTDSPPADTDIASSTSAPPASDPTNAVGREEPPTRDAASTSGTSDGGARALADSGVLDEWGDVREKALLAEVEAATKRYAEHRAAAAQRAAVFEYLTAEHTGTATKADPTKP